MKKLSVFITLTLATVFIFTITPVQAKVKLGCDALTGNAKGICFAAITKGCDEEENKTLKVCEKLAELYQDKTGEHPPWVIKLLVKLETDFNNDGTIDQVNYYTYDANGNMIKQERDHDNDGTIDSAEYLTYDANGNMIKQEQDVDNDSIIDEVEYFTYDAIGNMMKAEYDWDNNGTIDIVYYWTYE